MAVRRDVPFFMKYIPLRNTVLSLACASALGAAHGADQLESATVTDAAPTSVPASAPASASVATSVDVPASSPGPVSVASSPKGSLTVKYSTKFLGGGQLKTQPVEVGIVKRAHTATAVMGQVAVNTLLLVAGGGFSFSGFGKDDLDGSTIEGVAVRDHLQNPVPEAFVMKLQTAVSQFLENDAKLRDTTFKKPLIVAGGSARLVYENLSGNDEEQYRLKAYVMVYKDKERWSIMPNPPVYCTLQSTQPMLLADWAVDNFRGVKLQLDEMLASCQTKVLEALPVLLKS